jgi:hypothetical protein
VFKSVNGGGDWRKVKSPALGEPAVVECIAVSPDYANDRTVLASIRGRGLFKSENGGDSFFETGTSLMRNNHQVTALKFSPSFRRDKTLYGVSKEQFFKSTDSGQTWRLIYRPVRYEDQRPHMVRYAGRWETVKDAVFSTSSITRSNTVGSRAELTFVGSGVAWIGPTSPEHGNASVVIDGILTKDVSLASDVEKKQTVIFSTAGLPLGPHVITVTVSPPNKKHSSGYVSIDGFDVLP